MSSRSPSVMLAVLLLGACTDGSPTTVGVRQPSDLTSPAGPSATPAPLEATPSILTRNVTPLPVVAASPPPDIIPPQETGATPVASPTVPPDSPPVASDVALAAWEDTSLTMTLAPGAMAAYLDADGDLATSVEVRNVTNGLLSGFSCADGVCSAAFTPPQDFNGTSAFEYRVTAGGVPSALWRTVTITVGPVDDRPVGNPVSFIGLEDEPLLVTIANGTTLGYADLDGDLATGVETQGVVNGTLGAWTCDIAGTCTATFTPTAAFRGVTTFDAKVTAGGAQPSAWSQVTLDLKERARLTVSKSGDFGTIDTGNSATIILTVTNESAHTAATAVAMPSLSGSFTLMSSGCTATLAVGASCTAQARYEPGDFATQSLSFGVSYDANGTLAGGTTTSSVTATGNGRPVVAPTYPSNGSHWATWIARSDTAKGLFSQSDAACSADTATSLSSCVHAGEMRAVRVLGKNACTNLSATDALGVFDWTCVVAGSEIWFHSRLKRGKGLRDLITAVPSLAWRPNTVTISDGATPLATSASSTWWNTPIGEVTTTPTSASPRQNVIANSGSPKVWVVKDSGNYPPVNVDEDNQSLVTLTGVTMRYDGTNASTCRTTGVSSADRSCSLHVGRRNHIWLEVDIDSYNATTTPSWSIGLNGSRFVVVRNSRVERATGGCLILNKSSSGVGASYNLIQDSSFTRVSNADCIVLTESYASRFENIRIGSIANRGIFLRNSQGNFFRNVIVTGTGLEAVAVNNDAGGASNGNVFQGLVVSSSQQGFRIQTGGTGNIVHGGIVGNIGRDSDTGSDPNDGITTSSAGFDIQGPSNLLLNAIALNTRYFPIIVRTYHNGSGGCPSGTDGTNNVLVNVGGLASQKIYFTGESALRDCGGSNATTSLNTFGGWFLHDRKCTFSYQANNQLNDADCA